MFFSGMHHLHIFFIVLSFIAFNAEAQESYLQKKFPIHQLKEDFSVFRNSLEECHPGLYWYYPKPDIDFKLSRLLNSLDHPMTEREFFTMISSFISSIGCIHTASSPSERFVKSYFTEDRLYFPFQIKVLNKKVVVVKNLSTDTTINAGDEVVTINNVSMDTIATTVLSHLSNDGYGKGWALHRLTQIFHVYYDYFFQSKGNFRMMLKDRFGNLKEKYVVGMTNQQKEKLNIERYGKRKIPPIITLQRHRELNTAVLTIRRFSNWHESGKLIKFRKVLHDFMKNIIDEKVKHLVLDVGAFGGGNELFGMTLLSYFIDKPYTPYKAIEFSSQEYKARSYSATSKREYLRLKKDMEFSSTDSSFLLINTPHTQPIKPSKIHFDGNLYLIVGRSTASATSDFAAWVQSLNLATIVGEESGGSYEGNTSNWEFQITLPNTNIIVNIPLARYINNVSKQNSFGRGVIPAHNVSSTIDQMLIDDNAPLSYILKLIAQ